MMELPGNSQENLRAMERNTKSCPTQVCREDVLCVTIVCSSLQFVVIIFIFEKDSVPSYNSCPNGEEGIATLITK